MSRVIKFRAWNGDAMEYGGFYIHATGKIRPDAHFTRVKEGSPVMQSTGLHDRNGKEIYEGDILQHHLRGLNGEYSDCCFIMTWEQSNNDSHATAGWTQYGPKSSF